MLFSVISSLTSGTAFAAIEQKLAATAEPAPECQFITWMGCYINVYASKQCFLKLSII